MTIHVERTGTTRVGFRNCRHASPAHTTSAPIDCSPQSLDERGITKSWTNPKAPRANLRVLCQVLHPCYSFGRISSGHRHRQRAVALVDVHLAPVRDFPGEDFLCEWVLQVALHRALQRPRTVYRVVADPAEPAACGVGPGEVALLGLHQLLG